jgi:CRP-like cAMP-binding protein
MISPELLRRYPFFGTLEDAHLKEFAMISDLIFIEAGKILFKDGERGDHFYFLISGGVDLYYAAGKMNAPEYQKGIPVGEISPGEPVGISALIERYQFSTTALTSTPSQVIQTDAVALRKLMEQDPELKYRLTEQAARVAIERLLATRTQLAAAWA